MRGEIRRAVNGELEAGTLLGYPDCCVAQRQARGLRYKQAFSKAIIDAVGTDPKAVERALREDLRVPIPSGTVLDPNIQRTDEQFPFVQHIACDSCLASDHSPSAQLNRVYEELAREIAPALHRVIREMGAVEAKIGRITDAAKSQGLTPQLLEHETREQLDSLLRDRDRIYAELFSD